MSAFATHLSSSKYPNLNPLTKTQTASHAPPKTQAQAESVPAGESLALGIAPSWFVQTGPARGGAGLRSRGW